MKKKETRRGRPCLLHIANLPEAETGGGKKRKESQQRQSAAKGIVVVDHIHTPILCHSTQPTGRWGE